MACPRHRQFVTVAPLAAGLLAGLSLAARGDDWPTFRGPARSGVATCGGLLQSWPEGGPPLVWKSTGAGRGYASPAIARDRIYTLGDGLSTTPGDADEYLTCFERATGKA